jgi:hypothetical protein
MIYHFRNIAFRLWLTTLIAGLLCLWILPAFQFRIGLDWVIIPVVALFVFVFSGIGWATTQWGLGRVERLILEAGTHERDGMIAEAEAGFQRALAIFDSFLISPFVRRKKSLRLASRMARFYSARVDTSSFSEVFLTAYLQAYPEDEEIAEHWLQQRESRGGIDEEDQDLAFLIGDTHPDNRKIQQIMAGYYLLLERVDYSALQAYRAISEKEGRPAAEFVDGLADLFLRIRRCDHWALRIYLQSFEHRPGKHDLLRGIAAATLQAPVNGTSSGVFKRAERILSQFNDDEIKQLGIGFRPAGQIPEPRQSARNIRHRELRAKRVRKASRDFFGIFTSLVTGTISLVKRPFVLVRHSAKARRAFAGIFIAALAAGIGFFIFNTIGHLVQPEEPGVKKAESPAALVTDPFTLQVAAYLKQDYARQYVETLRKKDLDAYFSVVVSGSKKWYLVRISHFPEKKSARVFGQDLKRRGVIDDFYVANYDRP